MRAVTSFLIVIALATTAAAAAGAAPRSVRASYAVTMKGVGIGTINEQFDADGTSYKIQSDTKPQGLAALIQRQPLRFNSSGQITRDGLRPALFEARKTANDPPSVSAKFDWAKKQLTLEHDGKTETLSMPSGTQDRLSIMYQFLFIPPDRVRQAPIELPMTNGKRLSHYVYKLVDEVEIDTGLGRLKTLHLEKQRKPDDPVTEVWLSPQHHNLPVKLVIVERSGMRFEQILQSAEVKD